jgi:hypothetical protein
MEGGPGPDLTGERKRDTPKPHAGLMFVERKNRWNAYRLRSVVVTVTRNHGQCVLSYTIIVGLLEVTPQKLVTLCAVTVHICNCALYALIRSL